MSERNRVSYSREMRERAKRDGVGLVTVHIVSPEGVTSTAQGPASDEARDIAWRCFYQLMNCANTPTTNDKEPTP